MILHENIYGSILLDLYIMGLRGCFSDRHFKVRSGAYLIMLTRRRQLYFSGAFFPSRYLVA